ncbi:MAG: N-acetyl-gamma-glutamyl-phosphate reductase [Methylococcales bacterium]|jgi:N-acetyl-gamma-glutamyl-phosphate reductase
MIKVGIVGGTGYTGIELLRLLVVHPEVSVAVVTSRSDVGRRVDTLYPSLRGHINQHFVAPELENLKVCDVVFFATPNGIAMFLAEELLQLGIKVIDLSADFRLKDPALWEQWYGQSHACPDLIEQAVYGLPEINRVAIQGANLVACPGCYPTATQLGFLPLLEKGVVDETSLIADVKSGVSGAGRAAQVSALMSETGEGFSAYAVSGHRHLPEITQGLEGVANKAVKLTFVPHLTPMVRGIHATLYARLLDPTTDLQALFEQRYQDEYFVDVLPSGSHPKTNHVKGSNRCQLAVFHPQGGDQVVVLSVIDNLVKGAAGQAVQNMNLMLGLTEHQGLNLVGLYP